MREADYVQSIARIYSSEQRFQKWSSKQDAGLWPQELALIETHCLDHDAEICNIGCGSGRETFALYHMGYRHVRGIDCTPALLEIARRRSKELGLNLQFDLGTADNLPYPSKTFDVVTMFENLYGHITLLSARLRSLAEVRRVLKPGGIVLMTATSIYHGWRYFLFIKMLEIFRVFYNPCGMERGDKKMKGASKSKEGSCIEVARSHWFRPHEISHDARDVGLSVVQQTTVTAICRNPKGNSTKLHNQGRLVYVLQRPV